MVRKEKIGDQSVGVALKVILALVFTREFAGKFAKAVYKCYNGNRV